MPEDANLRAYFSPIAKSAQHTPVITAKMIPEVCRVTTPEVKRETTKVTSGLIQVDEYALPVVDEWKVKT